MLSMKIKKLCAEIIEYEIGKETHTLAGLANKLSMVCYYMEKKSGEDLMHIKEAMQVLKKKLDESSVRAIWHDLWKTESSNTEKIEANIKLQEALKRKMFFDTFFTSKLTEQDLIVVGCDSKWHQWALIGLVRKHLLTKKEADPFSEKKFEQSFMMQRTVSEYSSILSPVLHQCTSFPTRAIIELCSKNKQIADSTLKDLMGTCIYFEISESVMTSHPVLKEKIALNWQGSLNVNPLETKIKESIKKILDILKQKEPTFKNVTLDARPSTNQTVTKAELDEGMVEKNRKKELIIANVGMLVSALGVIIFHSTPIIPVLSIGTFFLFGAGLNELNNQKKVAKPPEKTPKPF